jgi:nucleotide-binding universal stress UspA family protein
MMTRPIVVGTDFSQSAEAAGERGTEIANETRAPLHIVHAGASLPRRLVSALLGGRDEHAERAALDAAVRRARERGVRAHGHLVPGAPTSALRTKARELSAELIVVGARGRVVPDTFVGATAERVAAFLQIAVLLVRRPVDHGYREVIIAAGEDVDVGRAVAASAIVAPRTDLSVLHAYGSPHEAAIWLRGDTEMSMLWYRRVERR